ncbi:hypothetical protein [Stenomitos frigidus]|uniref:Uncharacterized protein n=1 Tax=Stenomitos frigidus ULC18 TaxID=2107698 RepID=A0A2T1DW51_9CYAN|nr:hypothetical protein [Stenomitos frigidus]PSB24725.1 hypothetical protein C7B82_25265 [Stenomitos frigidus ULC18]
MNYPISAHTPKGDVLRQKFVDEELIAAAIVGVVDVARLNGQSLEELMAEVLADDALLDSKQRHWLSEVVAVAWEQLPS